jgi:hypothetical protein
MCRFQTASAFFRISGLRTNPKTISSRIQYAVSRDARWVHGTYR